MAMASPFPAHVREFAASPERSFSEHNSSQDVSQDSWRDILRIVRDVGPNLSAKEELDDLAAAEASVQIKDDGRAAARDQQLDELRQLSRQLMQAQAAAQRPASHPTSAEHDAQVRQLEQQQYATGKQLNEEQALVAKKEAELLKWKAAKEEVEGVTVGEEGWTDGKIIRLKLLSGAGFSIIPPTDGSSTTKVLIRNDAKEDVHCIPIDANRSKAYTANLIWSLASD
ncbi:hypothetical protein IAU60_000193 [Kwoniella sp. DSM 27419]